MSRGRDEVEVLAPSSLREAVQVLAEVGAEAIPLAGGSDLMVAFRDVSKLPRGFVLDLLGLEPELRGIELVEDEVQIGALTTVDDILHSSLLAAEARPLVEAARCFGSTQIRNRATIGGNVMNGSPAADSLPALLALDARVTLLSSEGPRTVPLYSFYADYRRPVAKPSELLVSIRIARAPANPIESFRKVAARRAQAIAKVILAGRAWDVRAEEEGVRIGEIRLAAGSVGPTPMRLFETERILRSELLGPRLAAEAVAVLRSEITPIDDLRSTAAYRRLVAGRLLEDFLGSLLLQA
ncbi:MAG: FAD binding domain-containing protein [Planctomycetes bacterium]|nr:FAD binding domain-containing protein [Planctomycetota bacterium]